MVKHAVLTRLIFADVPGAFIRDNMAVCRLQDIKISEIYVHRDVTVEVIPLIVVFLCQNVSVF